MTGPGEQGEAIAKASPPATSWPATRVRSRRGAGKEERETGFYDLLFVGDGADGRRFASRSGDKDPGYGSTSKMISEARWR